MSIQALHFAAPTIEIVSESPRLEMLQVRLKQAGLRPIKAPREIDPALASPILIDTCVISGRDQHMIISACQRYGNRPIVLLGESDAKAEDMIHLRSVDQISGLPSRLGLRQRQLARQREADLRADTTRRLTNGLDDHRVLVKPKAIYCGPQTPRFNALKNQLRDEGIDLAAALTEYSLKTACQTETISSVIFDLKDAGEPMTRLLNQFAGSTQRANLSLILLGASDAATNEADHLIETPVEDTETLQILTRHIHAAARRQSAQRPSDPAIRDSATGLYSKTFLETHLAAQLKAADQSAQPLTLIGIELKDHLRGAKPTANELLKHLRETDLAARYSARHIVVSLPATAYSGAIQMARRLQAQCGMIADVTVLERRQFHTAQSLIAGLLARPDLAASRRA